MPENIHITLAHPNGPKPSYATGDSNAIDLAVVEETFVRGKELSLIPTNIIVEYPEGYSALVLLRSSTPKKWGLLMPHGVGLIDRDYCGKNDVVTIAVYNFRDTTAIIPKGTRIAQLLFVRSDPISFEIGNFAGNVSRGGFGST